MAKLNIDKALIRELAQLMAEAGLSEIEWRDGDAHVKVTRPGGPSAAGPAAAAMSAPAAQGPDEPDQDLGSHPGALLSPMVGTVYVAAEPGVPPLVKVGDSVEAGQTVLIVEAMKTMNPIPAPRGGTISRILVVNEQPVEYGQVLMIIE